MIRKTFGCVRFLYNRMLAERKAKSESDQPKQIRYRTPASFKMEFDWLREVDSLALCNAEINLKSAFRNFSRDKRVGYPKFKSRKNPVQSYTTNNQKGRFALLPTTNMFVSLKSARFGSSSTAKYRKAIPSNRQRSAAVQAENIISPS